MLKLISRCISMSTPWVFQHSSPLVSQTLPLPQKICEDMLRNLSEGFLYSFDSICDAYHNNDTDFLEQCLEPCLFHHIHKEFAKLASKGYKFQRINTSIPNLSLNNLQLTAGVHIDRTLNLREGDYMLIKSVEELKSQFPLSMIKEQILKEGIDLNENILKSCLDFAWVYFLPRAPANLVLSVDAIFEIDAPLTVVLDGKDQVYEKVESEFHTFRFESEVLKLGTQKEAVLSMKIASLANLAKESAKTIFSNPWTITDIDKTMQGNPYVVK